ncbi:hypothetical protein LHP98_10175 [Rhodobacter sp. Har01]|uniref:hypothetical protein n=1 Tax=Rhodobacter sp. Har01 TaxID=2883999 RepID=UPI001D06E1D5|nr:hypothetical protein [Rhodobacter sp. Har01]MCB6178497.1 hypothetical protein [Rhodobacter sp. Har01]
MRHDWVFDVLRDLMAYAQKNDLPALAVRVEEALAVAEAEVAGLRDGQPMSSAQGSTRTGRPH